MHQLMTRELVARFGAQRVASEARRLLSRVRSSVVEGVPASSELLVELEATLSSRTVAAINATGVVLHTNLGRAPWSASAIAAATQAAGYATVELDRATGDRGRRGGDVESRIVALTGAEAAVVVNNGAAAVLLALRVLARGQKVLVSRGELVEIGGGFRVPDVLEESGATLVEVGTTNRTHLGDYQRALGAGIGAILRVHHSNFRQVGFVTEAPLTELARLGPPVVVDLGSGATFDVADEPTISSQLDAGASLVCFSGDKLLGGPQAGIVVGHADLVSRLRRYPLMRALRPGKVTLAALEATLDDWLCERAVPARAMIDAPLDELREVVRAWQRALPGGVVSEVVDVDGAIGGGSVPGRSWPSVALAITSPAPEALRTALLGGDPPVVGRVHGGALLLDARTVAPVGQSNALQRALHDAISSIS